MCIKKKEKKKKYQAFNSIIHTLLGSESLSGSSISPALPADQQSIADPAGGVEDAMKT